MNFLQGNKINRIRSYALSFIFLGLALMYVGIFFKDSFLISMFFILIGCLSIILSTLIYLWIGLLSTQILTIKCPNCNKNTKILGKIDQCMFCNQTISK